MRTFDPNRASIKQVLEAETVIAAVVPEQPPVIHEVLPAPHEDLRQLGDDFVAALKDVTHQMVTRQETLVALQREESKHNMETVLAATNKRVAPIPAPQPLSYVFEVERDETGRIARVYATPMDESTFAATSSDLTNHSNSSTISPDDPA